MRVVKSFVREDYEQKKFEAAAEDVCADFTRAERILALNGPLMQFCMYLVMVLFYLLALIRLSAAEVWILILDSFLLF